MSSYRRLATALAGLLACSLAVGCGNGMDRAEDYDQMRQRMLALSKERLPNVADALGAAITSASGSSVQSALGLGRVYYRYKVTARMTSPDTVTEAMAAAALVAAGYALEEDSDTARVTGTDAKENTRLTIDIEPGSPTELSVFHDYLGEVRLTTDEGNRAAQLFNAGGVDELSIP